MGVPDVSHLGQKRKNLVLIKTKKRGVVSFFLNSPLSYHAVIISR